MKNLMSVIALITFLTISNYGIGQKTLSEGTVKMEVTNTKASDPQMEMGLSMMNGSQTVIYFKGPKHAAYMSMAGGMVDIKTLVDNDKKNMSMYFDMMGNKMLVESNFDEAQTAQEKQIAALNKIEYDKNDTKEILGYKCYKVKVTNPEMEGLEVNGYVTEEIKTKANIIQGFQSVEFVGYPMEFTVGNKDFEITMQAKEIKDTADETKFKIDSTGYKKMTMDAFKKSLGGMGMGF